MLYGSRSGLVVAVKGLGPRVRFWQFRCRLSVGENGSAGVAEVCHQSTPWLAMEYGKYGIRTVQIICSGDDSDFCRDSVEGWWEDEVQCQLRAETKISDP